MESALLGWVIVLGLSGMIISLEFLVVGIGLVWSPFAGLICLGIAHRQGLPRMQFALAGAVYSALLVLPWIYLVLRMLYRPVPRSLVKTGWIVLFTLWLLGPVTLVTAIMLGGSFIPGAGLSRGLGLFILSFVIGAGMWVWSLITIRRADPGLLSINWLSEVNLIDKCVLLPFALFAGSVVLITLVFYVGLGMGSVWVF